MPKKKSVKILTSRDEVMEYMGISRDLYYHFIKLGLPVAKINGRVYAHTERLDEWFYKLVNAQADVQVPPLPRTPVK